MKPFENGSVWYIKNDQDQELRILVQDGMLSLAIPGEHLKNVSADGVKHLADFFNTAVKHLDTK